LPSIGKSNYPLGQEQRALVASGATAQQIQAWRQQNTARFEAQAQRLQTLALASYSTLRVTNRQPNIPANASQTLKNYLTTRMALANARALIHNRMVQQAAVSGSSLSSSQASQMREQENKLFQQQNAAQLILQGQRMQTLVTESAAVARPVPNVVVIPPNTSPQLAAYMTTRNQLRRERAEISNQYATATPSVRAAALQAWSKQNAGQIQQLQQQAQSLAGVSSTTEN
jgi:hypothetical protein